MPFQKASSSTVITMLLSTLKFILYFMQHFIISLSDNGYSWSRDQIRRLGRWHLKFRWIFMSLKGMFALPKKSIDYESHRLQTISCGIFPPSFQLVSQSDVSLNMVIYFSLEGCLLLNPRKMILEKKESFLHPPVQYLWLIAVPQWMTKEKCIQFPCSHIKKHLLQFESQPNSIV